MAAEINNFFKANSVKTMWAARPYRHGVTARSLWCD
jgi:hypothetical protein